MEVLLLHDVVLHRLPVDEHAVAFGVDGELLVAVERPALCGRYRGYRICGAGPPSSGETTVFAILK